jgi:hypothetical protein
VSDEKEWTDPIVAEVRAVRDRIAKQFNYDISALFKHFRKKEAEYEAQGFKFVDLPTKKVAPKKTGTHE